MSAPETKLTVVTGALALLALGKVDLEDEDPRAARISRIYDSQLALCMGLHRWQWSMLTRKLDSVAKIKANGFDTTQLRWPNGFNHAHVLPGDMAKLPASLLYSNNPTALVRDHLFEGGRRVYSDHENVWARGQFLVPPEYWPADWRAAFEISLASALAVPETESEAMRDDLRRHAHGLPQENMRGGLFAGLIAQDLAANPPDSPFLGGDPLIDARFEGPHNGRRYW